jgi:hypothetical protein
MGGYLWGAVSSVFRTVAAVEAISGFTGSSLQHRPDGAAALEMEAVETGRERIFHDPPCGAALDGDRGSQTGSGTGRIAV